VAREERDKRKKGENRIQINGEWFVWDERGETEETFLEEEKTNR
jgi:hypothetical protein